MNIAIASALTKNTVLVHKIKPFYVFCLKSKCLNEIIKKTNNKKIRVTHKMI